MSSGESSPPYEPSQPATASTSTPMQQKISFAMSPPPRVRRVQVVQRYDMCALCGVLLERALGRAGRRPPGAGLPGAARSNRVLDHFGLRLDDWGGRVYVLRDRKGRAVVVDNLGVLWVEAERLAGRPLDPLDPDLVGALALTARLPVALVTGFLGSGKTTLIARLLGHPEMGETAVIVNELGEIGDRPPPAAAGRRAHGRCSTSGCVCCTLRGDLADELRDLLGRRERGEIPAFGRVVVETTGLADPAPIVYTLLSEPVVKHHFELERVVTTVDAQHGLRGEESVKQAAAADRSSSRRRTWRDPAALERAAWRGSTRPREVLEARFGDVDPDAALRAAPSAIRASSSTPTERARARTATSRAVCLVLDEPLDWTAFGIWLTMLLQARGADVLRVKGLLDVGGAGPLLLERRPARRPPARPPRRVAGRRPPLAHRLHRPRARARASSSARSRRSTAAAGPLVRRQLRQGRMRRPRRRSRRRELERRRRVRPARTKARGSSSTRRSTSTVTSSRSTSGQTPPGSRPSSSRTRSAPAARSGRVPRRAPGASRPNCSLSEPRSAASTTRPSAVKASVLTCSSAGNGSASRISATVATGACSCTTNADSGVAQNRLGRRRQYERGMPSTCWPR